MKKLMFVAFALLATVTFGLTNCDILGGDSGGGDKAKAVICKVTSGGSDVYSVYPAAYTGANTTCTNAGGTIVTEIDDTNSYCKQSASASGYTYTTYTEMTQEMCGYVSGGTFIAEGEANSDAGIGDSGDDDPGTNPSTGTKVCGATQDGITMWLEGYESEAACTEDEGEQYKNLTEIGNYCKISNGDDSAYMTGVSQEECSSYPGGGEWHAQSK